MRPRIDTFHFGEEPAHFLGNSRLDQPKSGRRNGRARWVEINCTRYTPSTRWTRWRGTHWFIFSQPPPQQGHGHVRVHNYYGFNRLDAKRQGDEPLVFFNKNTSVKEVSDLEKLVRWISPDREEAGGGGDDADIDVDDASDAWAAASWARTAIAIKRVRATLQFEDEGQDAGSRMGKELSALAEVGFARMVRPHLPQPVVEDLYQH